MKKLLLKLNPAKILRNILIALGIISTIPFILNPYLQINTLVSTAGATIYLILWFIQIHLDCIYRQVRIYIPTELRIS